MTFQDLVKNHTIDVLENLLTAVLSKDFVEIHFDYDDNDQWAIITTHKYEEDKEISLRFHVNQTFDLHCGYYDDEDEFFEFTELLSADAIQSIPDGLKKAMQKIVQNEEGIRIPTALITKTRKA